MHISIHALLAESDKLIPGAQRQPPISIHALLAESDNIVTVQILLIVDFYPRSPCGERLIFLLPLVLISLFLSTLSLRRATAHAVRCLDALPISIHALLAESDNRLCAPRCTRRNISIHALLAESDSCVNVKSALKNLFLSTLSLRRATKTEFFIVCHIYDFYPRSPCGERPSPMQNYTQCCVFLSTLSLRRATPRKHL